MKKYLIGTAIALFALAGVAPAAQAAGHAPSGNAYGAVVQECGDKTVGAAITAGRAAHAGAKMTAKTIAMSHYCAS